MLGASIACVHQYGRGGWLPPVLQEGLVALCAEQPYAPSASSLREYLRFGEAGSGKVCFVLEGRPDSKQKPTVFAAALWGCACDEAELEYLVVAAQFRRSGWGSAIMGLSHEMLQHWGAGRCCLEVAESNLHALFLYRHLGYQVEGRRPRYYTDGQDALVMIKHL